MKHLLDSSFVFSTKQKHTLLSNQKTYGIWGKYSRPYNDIRHNELEELLTYAIDCDSGKATRV